MIQLLNSSAHDESNEIGLYIHVPFCVSKCDYCDFISVQIGKQQSNDLIKRYFDALNNEVKLYHPILKSREIKTIYFGGGTPSSVDSRFICDFLLSLRKHCDIQSDAEITIEVNPGTLTEEKLDDYIAAGINRFSMGLQSTNNTILKDIGRIHTVEDFLNTYQMIRDKGIENISIDLMFGLPGQTVKDIKETIQLVKRINPPHVSAYSLKIEEGTPLYKKSIAKDFEALDETLERKLYHEMIKGLQRIGIFQYELSNFSKPQFESRHNLIYWQNKPYLGIGVSAHSKLNCVRFGNTRNLTEYLTQIESKQFPVDEKEVIDSHEDLFETIMLGLRLNKGISIEAIEKQYGIQFRTFFDEALKKCLTQSLIRIDNGTIHLTPYGRDVANQVFLEFMI